MKKILILGSTGYIGRQLVPRLIKKGYLITCLVRDLGRASGMEWAGTVRLIEGDALNPDALERAFEDIEVIYYLIHSMVSGEEHFEDLDRRAAKNVAGIARRKKVKRIIYLGGLGRRGSDQSPHLRSRHEVGKILSQGPVPVTEFRAAVIVGSGSTSFEMVHHLVNRLPFMICPRWVNTRTQPIAVDDVLEYLVKAIETPESAGRSIDVGGPDITTYGHMMKTLAEVLNLRRYMLSVPVLTPRLSSYWVNLVTPIPSQVARALIEGLRHETICENNDAEKIFDFRPVGFREAVEKEMAGVILSAEEKVSTAKYCDRPFGTVDKSHLKRDRRLLAINANESKVFKVIAGIGGENGWYFADWLWRFRGFIDKLLGGVGMRKGRPMADILSPGDKIDFWRVIVFSQDRYILLEAEMKVWGRAWLEFELRPLNSGKSELIQTAYYYPRGVFGLIYWSVIYPVHQIVFRGLIRAIAEKSEKRG